MRQLNKWARTSLLAIAGLGLIGITSVASAAVQQTKIPVLIMAEDAYIGTPDRSSQITQRVLSALKDSMSRQGFRTVDDDFIAADLDWDIKDWRDKKELIETAKLANESGSANTRVRAMVLFRIYTTIRELSFSKKVYTRITGEVYDVQNNNFLTEFELEPNPYPAPSDCSNACIIRVVGKKSHEIAEDLGAVLAKKLAYLHNDGSANNSDGNIPSYANSNIPSIYTLNLKHFGSREALSIVDIMAEEFPGYRSHDLIDKGAANRVYEYQTIAKAAKLEEWMTILLSDMGFDVDKVIEIMIDGTNLDVIKLNATPDREISEDEKKRFN